MTHSTISVNRINIRVPLWSIKGFGIANRELDGFDEIEVTCSYTKEDGKLLYPNIYRMTTNKAKLYRTKPTKGVDIHWIPISDFTVEGANA